MENLYDVFDVSSNQEGDLDLRSARIPDSTDDQSHGREPSVDRPIARDLGTPHTINTNEEKLVPCRVAQLIDFFGVEQDRRDAWMAQLKAKEKKGGGGGSPHATAISVIRQCIGAGSHAAAYAKRTELQNMLHTLRGDERLAAERCIKHLSTFIDHFRPDVIRGVQSRGLETLTDTKNALQFGPLLISFNSRNVAIVKEETANGVRWGAAQIHVTDQNRHTTKEGLLFAHLLHLLIKQNFAEADDEVRSSRCLSLNLPGKELVESSENATALDRGLMQAAEDFAKYMRQ